MNTDPLDAACFLIARTTLWDRRPVDVAAIADVAAKLTTIARDQQEYVEDIDGDPEFVVRAVQYLARTHAIPPMRDGTSWFHDMLEVLVQLVYPNQLPDTIDRVFFANLGTALSTRATELEAQRRADE